MRIVLFMKHNKTNLTDVKLKCQIYVKLLCVGKSLHIDICDNKSIS